MEYKFDKEKFKESFNAKDNETKSADSFRLTHKPDMTKSGILFFHVQLVMKRKIIEYRARTT